MLKKDSLAAPGDRASDVWILDTARTPLGRAGGALHEVQPGALLAGLLTILRARNVADQGSEAWPLDSLIVGCASEGCVMPGALPAALARAGARATVKASLLEGGGEAGAEAVRLATAQLRCGEAQLMLAGGIHLPSRVREQRLANPDVLGALAAQAVSPRAAADVTAALQAVTVQEVLEDVERMRRAGLQDDQLEPVVDMNGLSILDADELDGDMAPTGETDEPWQGHHALARKALPQLGEIVRMHVPRIDAPALEGACLLLLGRADVAIRLGLNARARIVSCSSAGHRPLQTIDTAVLAFGQALERAGWSQDQVELLDVCSRFAGVSHALRKALLFDVSRMSRNPATWWHSHAGAASSSMAVGRLVRDLERTGLHRGALVCCGEVGGCVVILVERGHS